LLKQFGTPEAVFRFSLRQLEACDLPAATAKSLRNRTDSSAPKKNWRQFAQFLVCQLLNWSEAKYPAKF